MVTARKIRQVLKIGDTVYTTNGREVIPATVRAIGEYTLDTDVDVLFYDEHGTNWWLTRRVAEERGRKV